MPTALLVLGIVALVHAWHVHHPVRRPAELASIFFVATTATDELPLHTAALFGVAGLALALGGALAEPEGAFGLGALVLSGLGPVASWRKVDGLSAHLERAIGQPVRAEASLSRYAIPFWFRDGAVRASPNIRRDGERLEADLYRPVVPPSGPPRPLLIYVHGGFWLFGLRKLQGRLLIRRMVRAGWVAVSVQYRLSPWATWPAHIVDVKRAIAWARQMAPAWGADPGRIAIAGMSAGGHLSSLAAYSPGLFQPGFESADTSVQAVVSFHGVYDLVAGVEGRDWPDRGLHRLWRLAVLKRSYARAREAYQQASPVTHFGPHAPPTLVLHGDRDAIVPAATARAFVRAAEERVPGRVTYVEIPNAGHGFECLYSRRAVRTVEAAALWLERELAGGYSTFQVVPNGP